MNANFLTLVFFFFSCLSKLQECRCGKEIPSEEALDEDLDANQMTNQSLLNYICTFNCSGDAGQICGGESVYTIQYVAEGKTNI